MKRLVSVCALFCSLSSVSAETLWTEGFEGAFPPAGWITNSVDQTATYAFNGSFSARLNASGDYLITPKISNAQTLIFWSYTTASDPAIVVEYASDAAGPWTETSESPFTGYTEQWNGQFIDLSRLGSVHLRFRKAGSGTLYIDDATVEAGMAASNRPPVLDPVGNREVMERGSLSFTVTAADPVDNDPITLTATDLPPGAVFLNGVFSWNSAAPAGACAVTFYAADKDGTDSETITITVSPRLQLMISEVADPAGDGGDACRFVELYNTGTNTINLTADSWHLSKQVNGGTWYDIPLTGFVPPASAWVIAYSATDFQSAYDRAPEQESATVNGNGDDAYFLYRGGAHTSGVLIDVYGEPDTDGTDTAWEYEDSRAVRNSSIFEPNSAWIAAEWTIISGAEPGDMTPGAHGPLPQFENLTDPFVFLGDSLNLTVTAVNTVRTDVITLSATALPSGAAFPSVTGTNTVSSILTWNSPTSGTYTATFAASGLSGSNTASVTITVSSRSRMAGKFYGWSGDTVFKLENGQFWQQSVSGAKTVSPALYRPYMTITNVFGQRRMAVTNVAGYVVVAPLAVTESTMTGAFTGLHYQNIYQLADGTMWKQISFENISSTASPVTVWRWVRNGQQTVRFLDRDDAVIGTCIAEPSGAPVNAPVVNGIDGYFRGWQNKRVFALANGQFWQQTSPESSSQTLYRPAVTITNRLQTGSWRMSVAGASGFADVKQLTNVIRTTISGTFYGFGKGRLFKFTDGTWWKQTSSETSAFTRFNPEVLVWREGGTDYIEMPDDGCRVAAEKPDVILESTITNGFAGLHYGNVYRLAGGESRMQISFENGSTNAANPEVMLWVEGDKTNMLVRGERDFIIGTCTVVDPLSDADNDGLSNTDEVTAGSDPDDPQSALLASVFQPPASGRVLSWNAVEDRVYTIEWTPSLTERFQSLETDIVWPQNSWTDTVHSAETKGYYRITVRRAE